MKKQLDEMEKSIKLRTQSFGYKIAVGLLALWALYESYMSLVYNQRLNLLPSLVLILAVVGEGLMEIILKRKMIKGEEDYKEPNKVLLAAVAILVTIAILISIGSFILIN